LGQSSPFHEKNHFGNPGTSHETTYDATPGATRTGTLTIAGLTLAVTQAGAGYVAAQPITIVENGGAPIAVDRAGNVFFQGSDPEGQPGIKKWSAAAGSITTILPGARNTPALAVDGVGNLYFADREGSIQKWTASDGSLATLLSGPETVFPLAADGPGNVYFVQGHGYIKKWRAHDGTVSDVRWDRDVSALAVDGVGGLYAVSYVYLYLGDEAPDMHVSRFGEGSSRRNRLVSIAYGAYAYLGLAVDPAGAVYYSESVWHAGEVNRACPSSGAGWRV